MEKRFNCNKCGLCCRSLDKSKLYESLHDGDGICRYLDLDTNICTIYKNRPILCNIDLSYHLYFSKELSLEKYYNINYEGCRTLWKTNQKRKKEK